MSFEIVIVDLTVLIYRDEGSRDDGFAGYGLPAGWFRLGQILLKKRVLVIR